MSRIPKELKGLPLRGFKRAAGWRGLMIAALLGMALGSVSCVRNVPNPSQSQVQTGPGGHVIRVRPLGVFKLCVGDKKTFTVQVLYRSVSADPDVEISSDLPEPRWSLITEDNPTGIVDVSIVSSNPSVVSTTGEVVNVTAIKAGTTKVTFTTPDYNVVPRPVTIKVMDCKWEIEGWSKWTKSNGFRPRMVSHLRPTQFTADQDGNFDVTAFVGNVASPGFQVCSVKMKVVDSKANVKGKRSDDNVLTFDLKYDAYTIKASTTVTCRAPIVGEISDGNTGDAKIINVNQVVFNGLSVPSGGGAIIEPTTVQTDTTERGNILIIIIPIDTNGNYYLNP